MSIKATLTSDEIWPLINVLNEVCHGIYIADFEKILGEKQAVVALMERIAKLMERVKEEETTDATLTLNALELQIIERSFDEVCKEIDDWEFPIRVGILKEEAKAILKKIAKSPPYIAPDAGGFEMNSVEHTAKDYMALKNSTSLLTFEWDTKNETLEIHANRKGLEKLRSAVNTLLSKNGCDHIHLMSEDWGGEELSNEKQCEENELIHHVKICKWDT